MSRLNSQQRLRLILAGLTVVIMSAWTPTMAAIWYVKANATGVNAGTNWTDAYTELQSAVTTEVR